MFSPLLVLLLLTVLAATPRIDAYLSSCATPSDGFHALQQRGGWLVAPTDGVVRVAKGGRLEVSHCFFENHEVRVVRLVAQGLEQMEVAEQQQVKQGQRLGRGAKLQLTLGDQEPETFLRAHRTLFVPTRETVVVLVDVDGHRAIRMERGRETHQWEVGRGQAEGRKEQRGDLRTPRGLYFVVDRSRGPFTGAYGEYYGGAWVKPNYPNAFDAARGLDEGLVSKRQAEEISRTWSARTLTPQGTKLGGGIGFHGWNAPWTAESSGYGLSWGCVVLHPEEARGFLELTPVGTPVVLL